MAYYEAEGKLKKGKERYDSARLDLGEYKTISLDQAIEALVPKGYEGYVKIGIYIDEMEPPDDVVKCVPLELKPEEVIPEEEKEETEGE